MICPKCGTELSTGEMFCKKCGIKVVEDINNVTQNYVPPDNKINNMDERLLEDFIGPNRSSIMGTGFNCSCLFFGLSYIAYRKYWGLFVVTYLVMFIISLIAGDSLYGFGVYIVLGFIFNDSYVSHAKKSVENIKLKNPSASYEELSKKCSKKGKPSLFAVLLSIVCIRLIEIALQLLVLWGIQ